MTASNSSNSSVYFDNCLIGAVVRRDHPDQISALSVLLGSHQAGRVDLVASTEVRTEIERLPVQHQGPHLALYGLLKGLPASKVTWLNPATTSPSVTTDPLFLRLSTILPHDMDRRHVFHAMKQKVSFFATVDEHSILSHRSQLEALSTMRLGRPTEVAGWLRLSTST